MSETPTLRPYRPGDEAAILKTFNIVFREVWATLHAGQWLVSFGKVFPPNVVESPGGYAVAVDAETGRPEWFPAL